MSPLAKRQLHDVKVFNHKLHGKKVADLIYSSIKENIRTLTYFPGLGYVEPSLLDFSQCFRSFLQHPNIKIVYWVEYNVVKIAMLFDTRQEPEKLRYTIEHTSDRVCEDIEPYG